MDHNDRYGNVINEYVEVQAYVDDIVIVCPFDQITYAINILEEWLGRYRLRIADKTEY